MNKTTQELMNAANTLLIFHDNIPNILQKFPESDEDLEILKSYITYEIKKTLKDIIHIERL